MLRTSQPRPPRYPGADADGSLTLTKSLRPSELAPRTICAVFHAPWSLIAQKGALAIIDKEQYLYRRTEEPGVESETGFDFAS